MTNAFLALRIFSAHRLAALFAVAWLSPGASAADLAPNTPSPGLRHYYEVPTAAALALDTKRAVQAVDYAALRARLLQDKQELDWAPRSAAPQD